MRPRRIRRGGPNGYRHQGLAVGGFNAATANSPWRTTKGTPARSGAPTASMRPRRIRRGGRDVRMNELGLLVNASMRPRRIRRGGPTGGDYPGVASYWLQCGHGEFAVEDAPPQGSSPAAKSRFNAATANSPWRTYIAVPFARSGISASMRPRRIRRGGLKI